MNHEHTTQRQNRTKTHFRHALIELTKKMGYHHVSVKDIVDYAAYNRSTFYIHYKDKMDLAEDTLITMLGGLEQSVGNPYIPGQKVYTANLKSPSFNIVSYIYTNRDFFTLIKYEDTLPGLHTRFPQTILKIYQEQFEFETIDHAPVNMDYFKKYTAYGFYGLLKYWIRDDFKESPEVFIKEVIELSRTHMHSVRYVGGDRI
ncbi:TetR/AcrR family transcriptional regulator [Alkalicoccobacillus murimartini]|uniref:AcrR family transcriptional regulator n=1 Tax=Alkalicoccobacillus murimartini TaxID=171685 RepID=A0ABT9YML4_9BACI|nr:TetR/AcrR family transcriptional regulator [Alkalicoccobacillus murimartini]MDQ0209093.1 AcrR family transcriptional regulator [Alkalicoccobacillus murimartini]